MMLNASPSENENDLELCIISLAAGEGKSLLLGACLSLRLIPLYFEMRVIFVSNIILDVPKDLIDYEIELNEKKWSRTLYQILLASNNIVKKSNLDKYKKHN